MNIYNSQFDNYQELNANDHIYNNNTDIESDSDSNSEYSTEDSNLDLNEFTNSINHLPDNHVKNNDNKITIMKKTNYLVINSKDREWFNSAEKTFNYYVKFNPIGNTYVNKHNINDLKFMLDTNKITVQQYNNLIDNNTITIKGQTNNLHLKCDLKNITDIELTYCIMPNIVLDVTSRQYEIQNNLNYSKLKTLKDLPYIQVELTETDGIWNGTNDTINKSIGIMVPDDIRDTYDQGETQPQINGLDINNKSLIIFRNIDKWKKKYHPSPLNNLNLMTLRFLDPNGMELHLLNEILTINNINFFKTGTNLIGIRLITTYFSRYEYKEGENIFIKNFKFDTNFITKYDKNAIEKFINKTEGHKITNTYRLVNDTYQSTNNLNNVILLLMPIKITEEGNVIQETFNSSIHETDNIYNDNANSTGKILNVNNQHSIFFNVTTIKKDIDFNTDII